MAPFCFPKCTKILQKSDPKRHPNFDRIWLRFFLDFGFVLGAKLGLCCSPKRLQDAPKTLPRRPKTPPRRPHETFKPPPRHQDAPKTSQDAPKTPQDASKTPQDASRTAIRCPKSPSRHPQVTLRCSTTPQDAPRPPSRRHKAPPQTTILRLFLKDFGRLYKDVGTISKHRNQLSSW